MPASAERTRRALLRVTTAAQRELAGAAAVATQDAVAWRASLFAVAPLVVAEYAPASATLGLDFFEEIRDDANPSGAYTPTARLNITDAYVAESVARTTEAFRDAERVTRDEFDALAASMLADLQGEVQKQIASGFWDTVTENSEDDPDAAGWRRYARSGACKFCLMLAARGAVFTETSVRFAAHTNCHCVVGPSYDPDAPRADVIQYLASAKRSNNPETQAKRNARVRGYLNDNFPDARG